MATVPGIGQAIGALGGASPVGVIAQTALGTGQLIGSIAQKRRAESARPPSEDPEMRRFLSEIDRRRRNFETGAAFQAGRQQLGSAAATTTRGILRAGGGATGATIAGLTRSQGASQSALNQLIGQGEQRRLQLDQLFGNVLGKISDRRLKLGQFEQDRRLAQAASLQRQGTSNVLGGAARGLPLGGGGPQGQQAAQPAAPAFPIGGPVGQVGPVATPGIPSTQVPVAGAIPAAQVQDPSELLNLIIGAQGDRSQLAGLLGITR